MKDMITKETNSRFHHGLWLIQEISAWKPRASRYRSRTYNALVYSQHSGIQLAVSQSMRATGRTFSLTRMFWRSQVAMGEVDFVLSSRPRVQRPVEFFVIWCPWSAKFFSMKLVLGGVWSYRLSNNITDPEAEEAASEKIRSSGGGRDRSCSKYPRSVSTKISCRCSESSCKASCCAPRCCPGTACITIRPNLGHSGSPTETQSKIWGTGISSTYRVAATSSTALKPSLM